MQYEHAGEHMQYNRPTVLCIYSHDVCNTENIIYAMQNMRSMPPQEIEHVPGKGTSIHVT